MTLQLSEFYINPRNSQAVIARCKQCVKEARQTWRLANRDEDARRKKLCRIKNAQTHWASQLRNRYGLGTETYQAMYAAQSGQCAVCMCPETAVHAGKVKKLSVDHCHDTGKVRELLCSRCNMALGLLKENLKNTLCMATYIQKHKGTK